MQITLCLTHDCNLRCSYCYAGRKHKKSMSWEIAKAAIDFFIKQEQRKAGTCSPPMFTLGFFGGEPLLEWDLLRRCHDYAIEQTERLGIIHRHTITTNATLLTDEKATWLKTNHYFIGLSIDGNAAMHDKNRRYANGQSSYADCLHSLSWFPHSQDGEIICVVSPNNVEHLADSIRFLAKNSPLPVHLNLNYDANWNPAAREQLRLEYEKMIPLYIESFQTTHPISIKSIDTKIQTHLFGGYRSCDLCSCGDTEISVSAAGNFIPCARLVGNDDNDELIIGNVFEGYDSQKRARILLQRGNRSPQCAACDFRLRCMNWSGCVNYVTSGQLDIVGEFTCFHEKLLITTADKIAETLWREQNPSFLAKFYAPHLPRS